MPQFLTCPKCRALLEPKTKTCPYCGTSQGPGRAPSAAADAAATGRLGLWILSVNVLVFLLMLAVDPAKGDRTASFFPTPTHVAQVMFGANDWLSVKHCGQYWRFLTAMFLHVDLLHLLLNSVALLILTPLAAATFGAHRTTCVYFGAGLVASQLSHLAEHSSVGASGALCGLISALAVYGWRRGGFEGRLLTRRMVGWALFIVVLGMLWPGIDNWGHVGGFAGGALVGRFGAGVRVHGGRAERAWTWAARLCLAGAVLVAAVWMAPSVARGFARRDVVLYQAHARRTLDEVRRVLAGQSRSALPESFEAGPRGSSEVHAAVVRALAAARDGGSDVSVALRAAYKALRTWEEGLYCGYGIR
ncbi:MAG: rhomboid family intramembrane serine protease [Planctomycetota bacterium]